MNVRLRAVLSSLLLSLFFQSPSFSQPVLNGFTAYGGTSGNGVIFSFDESNGLNVRYNFPVINAGAVPDGNLIKGPGTTVYGFTTKKGINNFGVLYQYDYQTKAYSVLYEFTDIPTGLAGFSNGNLYGYTFGGTFGGSLLFEFNPSTKVFRTLYNFSYLSGYGPAGDPLETPDGKLLGVTALGADSIEYLYDKGTIFEYDITNDKCTPKVVLPKQSSPRRGLMLAANGKYYGLTSKGGRNGVGTLYEYDYQANTITVKKNFGTDYDGSYNAGAAPYGPMVQHANGKLYGNATNGSTWSLGGLFEYDPATNAYQWLRNFGAGVTVSTYAPVGKLSIADNGIIYGLTAQTYTSSGSGELYSYDPTSDKLNSPVAYIGASTSSFVQGSDSKLYSIFNYQGDNSGEGSIISYNIGSTTIQTEISFDLTPYGRSPFGALTQAYNGKYYGITTYGGNNDSGVIFEIDPGTNAYSIKYYFDYHTLAHPTGGLTLHPNGKLYGVANTGSSQAVFEFDPSNASLSYGVSSFGGYGPNGRLTVGNNGRLYGLFGQGGKYNGGLLYEFDPVSKTFVTKFNFPNPSNPTGGLLLSKNGKLYGLTPYGGKSSNGFDFGTLFEFDLSNNTYTKKVDFELNVATNPSGDLIEAQSGALMGYSSNGYIFSYDIATNTIINSYQFSNGLPGTAINPIQLLEAEPAKFYGVWKYGGDDNKGKIFKLDLTGGDLLATTGAVASFNSTNGLNPNECTLMMAKGAQSMVQDPSDVMLAYGDQLLIDATSSSGLPVQLVSSNSGVVSVSGNTITAKATGLVTISMIQPGNASYLPAPLKTFNVQVTKIPLTISAGNYAKKYGEAVPGVSFNYSGFKNGDTSSSLDQLPTINLGATATSLPGVYDITLTGGTDNNYTYTLTNGQLSVSKASLKIIADDKQISYASTIPALTLSYQGFVGSDNLSVLDTPPSVSTSATSTSAASDYMINVSGGSDNAYDYTYQSGTLHIVKATLTISVGNYSKKYGEAVPGVSLNYSGFKNGDTSSSLDQLPTINLSATCTSLPGVYDITLTGGTDNNYAYAFANGQLSVSKASLKIIADDKQISYASVLPTFTLSYQGFVGSDNSSVLDTPPPVSTSATSTSATGDYTINVAGGSDNAYDYTYQSGTLHIVKVLLTISAGNYSKKYGEAVPGVSLNYSGFKNGDTSSSLDQLPTINLSATATSLPGVYDITLTGGADNNYNYSFINGQLQVSKADQAISFQAISDKTFGDSPFGLNAQTTSGLGLQFSSSSNNISISGATLTMISPGRVTVLVSQSGNQNYNAAPDQSQSFCVNPPAPSITSTELNPGDILLTSSSATGNQWYVNNTLIDGAVANTYQVATFGAYSVKVTIGGCTSLPSKDKDVITEITNSKNEIAKVFPNPATKEITVNAGDGYSTINHIKVYNLVGDTILEFSNVINPISMDVQTLPSGLYIIEVTAASSKHFARFVKE